MDEQQLIAEKERHEPWFCTIDGYQGSGIGLNDSGELCIKIFTASMNDALKEQIRERVKAPVEFEESGEYYNAS